MPKSGKNIYKRKDGRWEGRYAKHRNSEGKTVYGSVYGKTCNEVKQRLAAVATTESTNKPNATTPNGYSLTFIDVSSQWLTVICLKVKPSTYAGYTSTLNFHILPYFGNREIQKLTAIDISSFAKEKLEKGRADGKGGLSPKTVRDMLSIIKSIMDFASAEKIIENPIAMPYPKHQQQTIRVLSRQEQSALEAIITTDMTVHKMGILLCLYTGIRIGEAYVKLRLNKKFIL